MCNSGERFPSTISDDHIGTLLPNQAGTGNQGDGFSTVGVGFGDQTIFPENYNTATDVNDNLGEPHPQTYYRSISRSSTEYNSNQ